VTTSDRCAYSFQSCLDVLQRHSRDGRIADDARNPGPFAAPDLHQTWIPAFAGMTVTSFSRTVGITPTTAYLVPLPSSLVPTHA
jgi:hypothetical protein